MYAELLRVGAPELPKDHYYKFWVAEKEMYPHLALPLEEKPWSRALHCRIKRVHWYGLRHTNVTRSHYIRLDRMVSIFSSSDEFSLEPKQNDGKWHLPHLALLADDAFDEFQKAQKKRNEHKSEHDVKHPDNPAYYIAHYLKKRIP